MAGILLNFALVLDKTETDSLPTESQSEKDAEHTDQTDLASQSDVENDETEKSSVASNVEGVSPSGVNRRTTILFAKKAQSSTKKDDDKDKAETDASVSDVLK